MTLESFLNEAASSSPAPGGGSVSALAASLSSALTSMVCRLTLGKKKYADVEQEMTVTLRRSEEVRASVQALIDADTSAFNAVMDAFGMPKETEEQKVKRSTAIESATKQATRIPLDLLRACAQTVPLVQSVAERGNTNSRSDAGVAALLLTAAAQGAAMNILINLGGLKDAEFVAATREESLRLEREVVHTCETIVTAVRKGLTAS